MASKKRKKMGTLTMLILSAVISACITLSLEPVLMNIYPLEHGKTIEACAVKYDLDKFLVMGIISAESGFDPDARSNKDAHGLMQLRDETAMWCVENLELDMEKEDIHKPENNIMIGCAYMKYLTDLYGGNVSTAIAAYNAGLGNVNKWLSDKRYSDSGKTLKTIPFAETKEYTRKVQNRAKIYEKLYGDKKEQTTDMRD